MVLQQTDTSDLYSLRCEKNGSEKTTSKLINLDNPEMSGRRTVGETLAIYVNLRGPGGPRCNSVEKSYYVNIIVYYR